jgi:hypothetical protein
MAIVGASIAQTPPPPTAPKSTGFADSTNTKKQKIDRKLIKTLASKSTWNSLPSIPSINSKNNPIDSGGFGIIRSPAELSSNPSLAEKSQKSIETFLNHKTIDWSKEMIVVYKGESRRSAQNEQLLREVVQLEDGRLQICLTAGPNQECYACPSMIAIVEKCEGKLKLPFEN